MHTVTQRLCRAYTLIYLTLAFGTPVAPAFANDHQTPAQLVSGARNYANLQISRRALDSVIRIETSEKYAGAISSVVFRGKEHIDTRDNGRELQSASSFDQLGECFNPTEAGGSYDKGLGSSSTFLSGSAAGDTLETSVKMAFWWLPGADYRIKKSHCGARPDVTHAQNKTILSDHIVQKSVKIGFGSLDNVIDYRVVFQVPERHSSAVFEAVTGYMPSEFRSRYYFDPASGHFGVLRGQGEQKYPVIIAVPDDRFAMGVFSPLLPQGETGYGHFSFPDTNKWSCVFRERNVKPGAYRYQCYVILGTTQEVRETITKLYELTLSPPRPSYGHGPH